MTEPSPVAGLGVPLGFTPSATVVAFPFTTGGEVTNTVSGAAQNAFVTKRAYLQDGAAPVLTAVAAANVLTATTDPATAGDVVMVGENDYEFVTALTEAKASVLFTVTEGALPDDGDTVTIGSTVYTWKTTLSSGPAVAFEVLIGANDEAAATNLAKAINDSGTEGTHYGTGTTVHPTVAATDNTDGTLTIRAKSVGTAGNAIACTDSDGDTAFATATLLGGVNAVPGEVLIGAAGINSVANLAAAINGSGTEGTTYATGTAAVANATAVVSGGGSLVLTVTADAAGDEGNAIVFASEDFGTMTNEDGYLVGGQDAILFILEPGIVYRLPSTNGVTKFAVKGVAEAGTLVYCTAV